VQLSSLNILLPFGIYLETLPMDEQSRAMQEIEERLEEVLHKVKHLLTDDEISLLYWACGKSNLIKENHVSHNSKI
jgi:hypothetical protein